MLFLLELIFIQYYIFCKERIVISVGPAIEVLISEGPTIEVLISVGPAIEVLIVYKSLI